MTRSGILESRESAFAWLPAIVAAGLFHGAIVSLGYWHFHDPLLDLISKGEQAANDPPAPAADEFFEVEWAPEPAAELPPEPAIEPIAETLPQPIPEPEPVAVPEIVEPVKPPEPQPIPEEIVTTPPPPETPAPAATASKPPAVSRPKPAIARPKTAPPRTTPPGSGPRHSQGTNPQGKGNPGFSPSDPVVGNKNFPRPPYPIQARQKRLQGTVILKISVVGGRVSNVVVIKSSGHTLLDSTASRHIKANWKFPAGLTRSLNQKIQFNLRS